MRTMSDPYDPYSPLTSLGQTSWGSLIRSQNELSERMRESNRQSAELVEKLQRRNGTAVATYTSSRLLTAEEKAELRRRQSNLAIINKRAPLLQRLSGKVVSYLDVNGGLVVNSTGDLAAGDVVPRREHLRRLQKAYGELWEKLLDENLAKKDIDETAADLWRDATERLALLKRGYFMSPIDSKGCQSCVALYGTRKTLFGKKIVKNKFWKVGIRDYDRRLRLFIDRVFSGRSRFSRFQYRDAALASSAAQNAFFFFLRAPSRLGKDG
jgi:hypothetical protein